MLRAVRRMLYLTAAMYRSTESFQSSASRLFFSSDSGATNSRTAELTRLSSVLEGCDYEHWLVVMEAPKGYPVRDEIVSRYVKTLAMALGSEEEAKNVIYSVSTKYYYAIGCKVPESLTFKIKSLPSVRWVLPDSYLCYGENGYGGEPFVNGEIAPYNEKHHEEWIRDRDDEKCILNSTKKSRRRKRKKSISN
ncbi:hypothetical protein K2173_024321 [Erythroxylum novogranatense]|uniref:MORF/ORRM1/DAG-like MORF domain-containing protein n=1 Tax=Erythroxylum novogranatense TaxID=1862640 RepID=A0AAV8SU27_9ROSI|nr:hypothetical protein K2173_024321 [Erythroxylum novogranatense]